MMNWILMKIMNPATDDVTRAILTQDYPTNPFEIVTVADKLSPRAIIEAGMRAQTGKALQRPFGSPVVRSPWDDILLTPRQLFQLPTATLDEISTATVIGKSAKKPLNLEIPIMITGMSYGGSLSLKLKMALAKGSAMAGTSTNTGESAVAPETRSLAKYLVGQYNRGGWLMSREQLGVLDAIEIQLGQGAFGGAVESIMQSATIGQHLRETWHLKEGQDATVRARMPGVSSPRDIVDLVNNLKSAHDIPVGVKIAASDFLENELAVIAQTNADFIVIDGAEGGTAVAPPTLEDDLGLPTLYGLVRALDWLKEQGIRDRFSVIAAGGLRTPGHFLKALAIGADTVYIGSIAVLAAVHTQVVKILPKAVPAQMVLYDGQYSDKLDVDQAANSLANFLKSCTEEMKLALQALGKRSVRELAREDLVTTCKDLAEFMNIRYAGSPRK
jgi:glutamate synthase domain-containing protein 2